MHRIMIIDNGDIALDLDDVGLDSLPATTVSVFRPGGNIGCAGAWNQICDYGLGSAPARVTSVIMINGDCAVAPDTFQRMLTYDYPALVCAQGFSCFRIDREIWQKVGPFDEGYYPVYWEDTDYRYRCKLAGVEIKEWPAGLDQVVSRPSFSRAKYESGITHGWMIEGKGYQGWTGEKQQWFENRWRANKQRYEDKWGGPQGEERFTTPFGK
jgi:hypothetical protein